MNSTPEPNLCSSPTPAPIERAAALVLRAGVAISVGLILLGMAISLLRHPGFLNDPAALTRLRAATSSYPATLVEVGRELLDLRGRAVIALGLVVLIATPLLRVVVSVVAFAKERDWLYTGLTLTVLFVLVLSFLVGRAT